MYIPKGAPVPLLTRLKNSLPIIKNLKKPSPATVALGGVAVLTITAAFLVTAYPMINNTYYAERQRENRANIGATREDLAQGLRPWTNPFSGKMTLIQLLKQALFRGVEKQIGICFQSEMEGGEEMEPHNVKHEGEGDDADSTRKPLTVNTFDLSEYLDDAESVDLIQCRVDHVPDFKRFKNLKELGLRRNIIKSLNPNISIETLERIDLYDNLLHEINNLSNLHNLTVLDLSYNRITKISGLDGLVNLEQLYLVHNKITKISGLEALKRLEILELGDNKISKLENLDALENLREFYIGKNKIKHIENTEKLQKVLTFSIPGNQLTSLNGIEVHKNLKELYVSDQGISCCDSVKDMQKLDVLDIANNAISSIKFVDTCKSLKDLWVNDNLISDWNELKPLSKLQDLRTVYFERNPIYKNDMTGYRRKMMLILPQVTQIDATLCR